MYGDFLVTSASPAIRPRDRAKVGIVIGDPCGIGPEVVVKAWVSGQLHALCRPVLIGSAAAVQQAIDQRGLDTKLRVIDAPERMSARAGTIDIIDSGALDPADITPGADNLACGRATGVWLDEADSLARAGRLQATVMGPISSGAMQMAGVLDRVVQVRPGHSYLLLASGALRVAHLTDHVALREVSGLITADLIESALRTLDGVLRRWGMARPRIAVAGFNPHAKGAEEEEHMTPGIERARAAGVDVTGPVSPDTVFRHCIEGRFDIVLAMYHDQGHIPVKLLSPLQSSALSVGGGIFFSSVGHGCAFDIAGRGVADATATIRTVRSLAGLAG